MASEEKDPLAIEISNNEVVEVDYEGKIVTSLTPIVIEEINDTNMDVNMEEFREAEPIYIEDLNQINTTNEASSEEQFDDNESYYSGATENIDLNGLSDDYLRNITFEEYSSAINNDVEPDNTEIETPRNDQLFGGKNRNRHSANRRRQKLPIALQGLMGEANVRFARGEIDMAAKMCFEIIRQVPTAPEPFQTLAMIYEKDQPQKSLQFALIAAHLSPRQSYQWINLANLAMESNDIRQAITCYTKAIVANPQEINLYETRAQLQEQIGDKKAAIRGISRMISHLGPEDATTIMKYAKMLTEYYIHEKNYEQALRAMDNVFSKCSSLVELSDVNIMVEILIFLKQFDRSLEILTKYTDIWVSYGTSEEKNAVSSSEDSLKYIESCHIPDHVHVDLKAKCLVVLIELNELQIAEALLPNLYENESPEISGDLFLDVAEALMSKKQFQLAMVLLEPLIHSINYSLAAVWLRYAECWLGMDQIIKAIEAYEIVCKLSPRHMDARMVLARLYQRHNRSQNAVDILYQDPEVVDYFDPNVLFRRTQILYENQQYDEYFESALKLFSRHCEIIKTKAEITALTQATCLKVRLECLQRHRLSRGESPDDSEALKFKESAVPSFEEEFQLFLQVCRTAYDLQNFGLLQKVCFSALTSNVFDRKSAYLMFLCLVSSIYVNDTYHGFNIIRDLVRSDPKNNYWNLLNVIIQRAEDSRHNRFMMRLLTREDVFSHLHILHANNCLVAGTYKYALNDYISLFKSSPNALLSFLIAVTQLQMACQKFASRKNQAVVQAISFLQKYAQMRGKGSEQEVSYNMGRAFHQLGLIPAAVHYYKQVLTSPTPKLVKEHRDVLDLKREAAYNLHLIYLQSDNRQLATMYLQNYITV